MVGWRPLSETLILITGLGAATGAVASQSTQLLHAMFQDHAVLQRDQPLRIYGRAAANTRVAVSLNTANAEAEADSSGHWTATLPPMNAGGPYSLTARASSGDTQTVRDVLVGDVLLCSGQSNMQLQVLRALDSWNETQASANDRIRMMTIGPADSVTALEIFKAPVQWQVAGPATVPDWSAVCFYFARELQKSIDVPIGLVSSAWGGSNIRAWMSESALQGLQGYERQLEILRLYARDAPAGSREWGQVWQDWWTRTVGSKGPKPWELSNERSDAWHPAPASFDAWEKWGVPELKEFDGMLWYRSNVRLTAAQARQKAHLTLGPVDEIDHTWINGTFIGSAWGPGTGRSYEIPGRVLRAGDNVIVVNALDTYGAGGLSGPADAQALRFADGTSIPLTAWQYQMVPASVGAPPRAPWDPTGGLTMTHNAMIAPIGSYNFRGVAWYQGESNVDDAEGYQAELAALMAEWRRKFNPDLPFLIVQLANYGPPHTAPVESKWAALREAQRLTVAQDPHAGLAVAIDIGDRHDIHPGNKQEVGRRLARAARHVIYNEAIAPSGPVPVNAQRSGTEIVVSFKDVDGELVAYSAAGPIGFELCGTQAGTCRFVAARLEGSRVRLEAGNQAAARVRYCWADAPVCTLYDRAKLPAGPFELAVQ